MEVEGLEPPINYKTNNMSYRYKTTTEEDLGVYVCEAQLDSSTTETKVILKLAGKII